MKRITLALVILIAGIAAAFAQNVTVIGPITPGDCAMFNSTTIIKDGGFPCPGSGGALVLPNGTTATTQPFGDNTAKVATDAFVNQELNILYPSTYGAKCDGVTDDTAAFVALSSAASTAKIIDIEFPHNATCIIWPTDASVTATPILMQLNNVTGVMNFNGSSFHSLYTGNLYGNPVFLSAASGFTINGYAHTSDRGKQDQNVGGVNHITINNGSHGIVIHNMTATGGGIGIQCSRAAGSAVPRSYDIQFDESVTNVYYPINAQFDCDSVKGTAISNNAGRPFFFYNVKDWDVTSVPTNQTSQGIIAAFATSASDTSSTTGIKLRIVNTSSTTCNIDPYAIVWEQYPTNTSTQIANIDANISLDVDQSSCSGGNYNSVLFAQGFQWTGGVGGHQQLGDAGHTGNIVVRDVRVKGSPQVSLMRFMTAADGWGDLTKIDVAIRDMWAPDSTVGFALGGFALSHVTLSETFAASAAPTITGTTASAVQFMNVMLLGIPLPYSYASFAAPGGGNALAASVQNGGIFEWFDSLNALSFSIYSDATNVYLVNQTTKPIRLYSNAVNIWNWLSSGEYQPQVDNSYQIGDATHRVSNVFATGLVGTTTNDNAASGNIGQYVSAVCGAPAQSATYTATVTITIASPAVITWTSHPFKNTATEIDACPVVFTTTGALPTGITSGTTYWVIPSTIAANTFEIATSVANALAGTPVNTSGTQSGVQTATGGTPFLTTAPKNVSGISLTAGDWDVWINGYFSGSSTANVAQHMASISQTTDTLVVTPSFLGIHTPQNTEFNTSFAMVSEEVGPARVSLSATTTIFFVGRLDFSPGTTIGWGVLQARRVR